MLSAPLINEITNIKLFVQIFKFLHGANQRFNTLYRECIISRCPEPAY